MNTPDALDFLIMKAIPYAKDTDLERYLSADPDLTLSEKDKEKIIKRTEKSYADSHKKYRPVFEAVKRVAAAVLIAISLLFASAMSVKEVREAVWDIIVGWYEEYIRLDFSKGSDLPAPSQNEAAKFVYKEPRIDEGYERYVIAQDENEFGIEYEKDSTLIVYRQYLINDKRVFTNNHNTVVSEIKIGNFVAYAFTYFVNEAEQNTIVWQDETYIYSIYANLPLEELKAIAETIE